MPYIAFTKGIGQAVLDFGIDLRINKKKVLCQCDKFQNNLLKLAADLGLGIELSIYAVEMGTILEREIKEQKPKKNFKNTVNKQVTRIPGFSIN
jgi:hypothetical protein